jgi:type I restriction enzyme R subunit
MMWEERRAAQMGKKDLSEEDIKVRYITPAVEKAGWDKKQIRYEYYFTAGRGKQRE